MIFQEGELLVRRVQRSDADVLLKWLNDPQVLQFYEGRDRPQDRKLVEDRFLSRSEGPVAGCMIEYGGRPIGWIQFYPLTPEEKDECGYGAAALIYGTDQFIGETDCWGKGIGTRLVTAMVRYLCGQLGAEKVVMDPQTWNLRAVRCYEKCGFRRLRLLPQHEWHEGAMRDCWLIEYDPQTQETTDQP